MTDYVVLVRLTGDANPEDKQFYECLPGVFQASSAEAAEGIAALSLNGDGYEKVTLVAIPARSWTPDDYTFELKARRAGSET